MFYMASGQGSKQATDILFSCSWQNVVASLVAIEKKEPSEEFEEDFWNEEFEESFRALNRFFKQLQFSKMMWNYPTLSDLRCTCTHVNAVHYWIVYAYACWEV